MELKENTLADQSRPSVITTIRSAWRLTTPFFSSEHRWRAIKLVVSLSILTIIIVITAVLFTYWQRGFFNALEAKDWNAFIALLLSWHRSGDGELIIGFIPLLVAFVCATVYRLYLRQRLQLHWRKWMTEEFLNRYFAHRTFFRLSIDTQAADNPDQRISEDVNWFTEKTLALSVGFFENLVSVVSFVILLWALSTEVMFWGVEVPGSLVWIALFYALLGTYLTHLIGRRLIVLNYHKQRLEAEFRLALIRVRENSESIAFYRGEARETKNINAVFSSLLNNFSNIIDVTKRVTFAVSSLNQANLVFPLIIAAPAYFAGRIPLGGVFQTANALNKVVESLSWFIENYINLADYSATIERLIGFEKDIARIDTSQGQVISPNSRVMVVACSNLSVRTPSGETLLEDAELNLKKGEWLLLTGPSGSGKTSFLRTIAGLWQPVSGSVATADVVVDFIPQRPYFPDGTLKEVLSYPQPRVTFSEMEMLDALNSLKLSHLNERPEQRQPWMKILSGGEMQRLAIARVILRRPMLLFCDEVTSQLDTESEHAVYSLMKKMLPEASVISIGHRESIAVYHDRKVKIQNRKIVESI